jgi:hypothetical protein
MWLMFVEGEILVTVFVEMDRLSLAVGVLGEGIVYLHKVVYPCLCKTILSQRCLQKPTWYV